MKVYIRYLCDDNPTFFYSFIARGITKQSGHRFAPATIKQQYFGF
jgi:hypothetical protein